METNKADFTLTFYYLSTLHITPEREDGNLQALFEHPEQIDRWLVRWRQRLSNEVLSDDARQKMMLATNPVYIPRNHQIEAAIRAAEDHNDFSVFYNLHEVLQNPFQRQTGKDIYMRPPEPDEIVEQTFCGT
jgi:uncharacterized protein YdiU (UPF0061 family)